MAREDAPADDSRRRFLQSSIVSGLAIAGPGAASDSASDIDPAVSTYPDLVVGKAARLAINQPLLFTYPDAASACLAVKLGRRVPDGVGPDLDIVAFSSMCSHMGCLVSYEAATARLKCACHFSMFDPEKSGQMIIGQATQNLPQVILEYRAADDTVHAVAIRGLIYGRQTNLL